jgi:hypothetical protein
MTAWTTRCSTAADPRLQSEPRAAGSGGIQLIGNGVNAYPLLGFSDAFKRYRAVNLGVKGMVPSHADINPRFEYRASLTNDDVSRPNNLTSKPFHAKPLRLAVSTVA